MSEHKGMDYLWLGLYAFCGLGMEALYAYLLEPILYGAPMQEWTTAQIIMHWIATCITWGIFATVLIKKSDSKYDYPLTDKEQKMSLLGVALCIVFIIAAFLIDYMSWDGFKVYLEYVNKGLLLFTFQYIYYAFETMLFLLIIVFGQKACEVWFHRENFPYGGVICGLTWGLAHMFTKNIMTGLLGVVLGVALGSVYLVVNRDLRKAYVVMFLMFVL
ncbi:MAG: hypothetical protein J1F42_11100 [Lachnospiraceae bacterium]|nr:hypothetical protein [Lachnospiraceae bacterium]